MPEGTETQGTPQTPPPVVSPPGETAAGTPGDTSSPEAASPDRAPSLIERLFGMGRRSEDATRSSEVPSSGDGTPERSTEDARTATPGTPVQEKSTKREVSDEELDRLVQAETDRREARRQQQAERRANDPSRRIAELEQQAHETRKDDPYKANDLFDEAAALRSTQEFLGGLVGAYDAATLDVLKAAVPEASRAAVFASDDSVDPLEDRKAQMGRALDALKQQWKADGVAEFQKKLRADTVEGRALRQQTLLEQGEGEPDTEPELLVTATPVRNGRSTNDQANEAIRQLLSARR